MDKAATEGKRKDTGCMNTKFNRERIRFDVKQPDTLVIQGWFEDDTEGAEQFEAERNGAPAAIDVQVQRGVEVTKKYLRYKTNVMAEYFIRVPLTDTEKPGEVFEVSKNRKKTAVFPAVKVYHKTADGRRCIYHASASELLRISRHLMSWVEKLTVLPDGRYQLRGWYMGVEKVQMALLDHAGHPVETKYTEGNRIDILGEFPEAVLSDTHAFELTFAKPQDNYLRLAMKGGGKKALYPLNCKKMLSGKEGLSVICKKSVNYLKRKGFRQFVKRVEDVVLGTDAISYERWRRKYGVKASELERQRTAVFAWNPTISIVVPLYRTPERFLRALVQSVQAQTYSHWELILSDGSGADSPLTALLDRLVREQKESGHPGVIRALHNGQQLRISENTNAALWAATGDFIAFGDHDDLFSPDALYECVRLLNDYPDTELIYSDEDKVDGAGKRYFEPHFKSDYNPDLLESMNYFCHLVVVKDDLQQRVGYLDADYDGAQDYDFVLRCTEQTTPGQIRHIPKILYHWRSHQDSTAENPESKRYAFEAGRRAVQAHYDRLGIVAAVREGEYPGLYETEFTITDDPMISILIPNKDHLVDLQTCIRSITEQSDYENYEILIIENNSTEPETFAGYEELGRQDARIRVLRYEGSFNFSAINNFGAAHAKGAYLLLLNNDTEMIHGDCLRQLLGPCQRPEVGITGALLYYGDDTIQHAGVVLGFGGIAGHAFIGEKRGDNGYFSRIICRQDYSAVTAACLMVKTSVYREVGGMSEDLRVAFNDIDFCMKVRKAGYLVVYNPGAELYHFESKSRGLENTQEKIERFNGEIAQFLARWGEDIKAGDPYYNPNLSLDKADFSLRL